MKTLKLSPAVNVSDEFRKEFDNWLKETFCNKPPVKSVTKETVTNKPKIYRKPRK
jgi:hypothetical protein